MFVGIHCVRAETAFVARSCGIFITTASKDHGNRSKDKFGGGFSDPPTQAEMQAFADYVESLRTALLR